MIRVYHNSRFPNSRFRNSQVHNSQARRSQDRSSRFPNNQVHKVQLVLLRMRTDNLSTRTPITANILITLVQALIVHLPIVHSTARLLSVLIDLRRSIPNIPIMARVSVLDHIMMNTIKTKF